MGFAAMDEGFYSSSHPDLKTDSANPLGLVRVTDEGKHLIYGIRRLNICSLAEQATGLIRVPDLSEKDYLAFVAVNPANKKKETLISPLI